MLALTQHATEAIEGILTGPGVPDGAGVRIATTHPTDGSSPSALQVTLAVGPDERDEVIEEAGARVFVEEAVTGFLDDKMLDVENDGQQVRFAIVGQG